MIRIWLFACLYAAAVVGSGWTLSVFGAGSHPVPDLASFIAGFVITVVCTLTLVPLFAVARRFLSPSGYLTVHILCPYALSAPVYLTGSDILGNLFLVSALAASVSGWLAVDTLASNIGSVSYIDPPLTPSNDRRRTRGSATATLVCGFFAVVVTLASLLSPSLLD